MGCSLSKQHSYDFSMNSTVYYGDTRPWTNVISPLIVDWNSAASDYWGFPLEAGVPGSKYCNPLQPWATRAQRYDVLLPAPADGEGLDVKYSHDEVQVSWNWQKHTLRLDRGYAHRLLPKYRHSPLLSSAQVIGCREHVVVIQVVCKDIMEFLLADLNRDVVIGRYVEPYREQPYLCEAIISPDMERFIVKANLLYVLKYSVHSFDDGVRVVQPDGVDRGTGQGTASLTRSSSEGSVNSTTAFPAKQFKMRPSQKRRSFFPCYDASVRLFQGQGLDLMIAYDPRYKHSKVAIANLTKRAQNVLCLYCMKQMKIVQKVSGPQSQRTQNLTFSPDGELLASLMANYKMGTNMYPRKFDFISVIVYSTLTLDCLQRIKCFGMTDIASLTPAACFPLFSAEGTHMAVGAGTGTSVNRVDIYNLPGPSTLKGMCRLKIRKSVSNGEIACMKIDPKIKDYLIYHPVDD